MATSIHLHTEVKINGKWEHYGDPAVGYKYRMFAKMCGVRLDHEMKKMGITPIDKPRGLPKDISEVTKFDLAKWKGDAHSQSYLTAPEILLLEDFVRELHDKDMAEKKEEEAKTEQEEADSPFWNPEMIWGYLFGNSWGSFTKYPEEYANGLEDVRFVFWFDC